MEQNEQEDNRESARILETSTNTTANDTVDDVNTCVYVTDINTKRNANIIIVETQKDTVINVEPSSPGNARIVFDHNEDRPNYSSTANAGALDSNTADHSSSPSPVYQQGSPQQQSYPLQPAYQGQGYPHNTVFPHPEGYAQRPTYPQGGYGPGQGYPPNSPPVYIFRVEEEVASQNQKIPGSILTMDELAMTFRLNQFNRSLRPLETMLSYHNGVRNR
ncbi:hypothetical protein EVAR_34275_1 [Eumeta japonica]|uniref:Uncharacterized protein n=1 Tax=Eumeta variegata TaxID=151549 RepID=A0A4C1VYN8_EUMVA|nr:hypothetical protein EVAR_34275_1 [Eumeta japonica]